MGTNKKKIEARLKPEDYAELEKIAQERRFSKYKIVEVAIKEFIRRANDARSGVHIIDEDCVLGEAGTVLIDVPEKFVEKAIEMVEELNSLGFELPITEVKPNDSDRIRDKISSEIKESFSGSYNPEESFEYEKPKRKRL